MERPAPRSRLFFIWATLHKSSPAAATDDDLTESTFSVPNSGHSMTHTNTMRWFSSWTNRAWALSIVSALQKEPLELTGVDAGLQQPGDFWLDFSEADMRARFELLDRLNRTVGGVPFQVMDPPELKCYLPGIGPALVGSGFCPLDGNADPLMLLHGLHAGLRHKGAEVITSVDVAQICYDAEKGVFIGIGSDIAVALALNAAERGMKVALADTDRRLLAATEKR